MRCAMALAFALALEACASSSAGGFVIATRTEASAEKLPGEVARSAGGRAVLFEGGSAPESWEVVSKLDASAKAKVYDLGAILGAVETGDPVPVYVEVDASSMTPDALKGALAKVGFEAQSVSGDIVTGRLQPAMVGPLSSLPFVKSVSASSKAKLRDP